MLNAGISFLVVVYSVFSANIIGKTRTGTGVFLKQIGSVPIIYLIVVLVFSVIIGFFLNLYLAKFISKIKDRKFLLIITSFILLASVLIFTNIFGWVIVILSSLIGVFTIKSKNPRILMLNAIITPVFISFLI